MSEHLDFDYLNKLFKSNPEKFEEVRAREIEKLIQNAASGNQRRLRGLQFQIDAKRKIHEQSPIGACMAISKMMHESFENLRFHLNQLTDTTDPLSQQPLHQNVADFSEENSAEVLQFRS